jgi:serpin B
MKEKHMRALAIALACLFSCACTSAAAPVDEREVRVAIPVPEGAMLLQSKLGHKSRPAADGARDQKLAENNRAFAWDLYRKLATDDENLFFSPYSISSALAMTYAGAKGKTASELASALHFELPQNELHAALNHASTELEGRKDEQVEQGSGDGFELHIVNQAWGHNGYEFLASYLDVLGVNYGAGLFLVDFEQPDAARDIINGWVLERTDDRIRDLLPQASLTRNTKLVLTDAIYFKASWLSKFDPKRTYEAKFHAPAGERTVRMMEKNNISYGEGDNYQAISLPYLAPDVSMILLLPAEGQFAEVRAGFDAPFFAGVRAAVRGKAMVARLPRWKFESANSLKKPLEKLGASAVFKPGAADLSGMDGQPGALFVDDVYHKAFVAVDEQGTEAAAATAVVGSLDIGPVPKEVNFDRPFMFVIFDRPTEQILFIGQLVDPG